MKVFVLFFTLCSLAFSQKAIDVNVNDLNIKKANGGELSVVTIELKQKLINQALNKIVAFFTTRAESAKKYESVSFEDVVKVAKSMRFIVVDDIFVTQKNKRYYIDSDLLDDIISDESKTYSFCLSRIFGILRKENKTVRHQSIAYLMSTGKSGYLKNIVKGTDEICEFSKAKAFYNICLDIVRLNYFSLKVVDALRLKFKSRAEFFINLEKLANLDIKDDKLKTCIESNDFVECVLNNRLRK